MFEKLKPHLKDARVWVGAGLTMLMLPLFWASSQKLIGWEETVLRWLYDLPSFLTPLFIGITFLGSAWTVGAVVLFYVWRKKRRLALELGLASGAAYSIVWVIKRLVARPRPPELLTDIVSREIFLESHYGFPSGHATVSTVLALLVMPLLPKNRQWLAPLWIVLVAVSRMHLGVHAPLDVIGGIGVGLAAAGFLRLVIASLSKSHK